MSAADDEDRIASFRLTDEEARVANIDIRRRSGVPDWSRRLNWVMAVILIAYGFIDPLLWHTGAIAWKIELLGVAFALNAAAKRGAAEALRRVSRRLSALAKPGCFASAPFPLGVSWKAVRSAFDDGDLIRITLRESLRHPVARHYVVPKRVLPDDGVALWELLGESLVGKRMLIPSPFVTLTGRPAIRAIMNTRS